MRSQAEKYGDREVFRHKDFENDKWISTSWTQFSEQVELIALAFLTMGVREQENIATYTQNRPEGLIIDFAAYENRAVVVPLYATSSQSQIEYIINEAEVRFLFVGGQFQYDNAYAARKNCTSLEKLIILDPSVKLAEDDTISIRFEDLYKIGKQADNVLHYTLEQRMLSASDEDLVSIIYTSGTTGEPKGVMLTNSNFNEAMRIHIQRLKMVSEKDISLCFLPLTHIFERAWTYFCLVKGIRVVINQKPDEIQSIIKEVRPTIMCSVPRFWEKVYTAVQEKISTSKGIQRIMMMKAVETGRKRNIDFLRLEKKVPISSLG